MQTAEHITFESDLPRPHRRQDRLGGPVVRQRGQAGAVHKAEQLATPEPSSSQGGSTATLHVWQRLRGHAKTGKVLWRQRLALDHQVGPGSSPVLLGEPASCCPRTAATPIRHVRLDKKTGQTVWKTTGPPIITAHHGSPQSVRERLLVRSGGARQMIAAGRTGSFRRSGHGERDLAGAAWSGLLVRFGARVRTRDGCFSTGCFKAHSGRSRGRRRDVTSTHVAGNACARYRSCRPRSWSATSSIGFSTRYRLLRRRAEPGRCQWQKLVGRHLPRLACICDGRVHLFRTRIKKKHPPWGGSRRGSAQFDSLQKFLEGAVGGDTGPGVDRSIFLRTDSHLYRIQKQ